MSILYLTASIVLVCIAHLIRISRWEMFIEIYEKPKIKVLIQALATGYFINYIVPFKIGDLFRAIFAGHKMKNKYSLGLSSVIIDRYLDILFVGLVFCIFSLLNVGDKVLSHSATFYIFGAVLLFLIPCVIYLGKKYFKLLCKNVAKIFNENIESALLVFIWALVWNFKDIFLKINKTKLFIKTLLMWTIYFCSYYLFASCLNKAFASISFIDVFKTLFVQHSVLFGFLNTGYYQDIKLLAYWYIYLLAPVIIMILISYFYKNEKDVVDNKGYLNLLPQIDFRDKLNFLETYFAGTNKEYLKNYLKVNQDISIIRDCSSGSNATTILCLNKDRIFWRKYTFETDVDKLYQQIEWIEGNKDIIPLPKILKKEKTDLYCYYDMEHFENAVSFFEYIHSMPFEKSYNILTSIITTLEDTLYKKNVSPVDDSIIQKYIQIKVTKNIETIIKAKSLKNILHYDTVFINGLEYKNLSFYYKYLNWEYLKDIFKNDSYSVIHGDLTIENIICKLNKNDEDTYYIIDPNSENIHNSSNLDYGKLLQSLHGGYEFIMKTKTVQTEDNNINFMFTKSYAYNNLYQELHSYMMKNFGYEKTRSIYFHEIIHWLRLLPYKINKDKDRVMMFYAGLLIVLNDIYKMYIEKEDGIQE